MIHFPKRYWFVLLTYVAMQFSGIIGFPIIKAFFPKLDTITISSLWNIIAFSGSLIIILYILRIEIVEKRSKEMALLWLRHSYRDDRFSDDVYMKNPASINEIIAWSILGVFLAYFSNIVAGLIEIFIFKIDPGSENTELIMEVTRSIPLFAIIPMIIGPILEEIVFRQIIFRSLYRRFGFFFAGLLSALIFAIVHVDFAHILVYTSMGFVFAFVYIKTKRIIVPILVHIALNSITIVLQYNLTPEDLEKMNETFQLVQSIFIGG